MKGIEYSALEQSTGVLNSIERGIKMCRHIVYCFLLQRCKCCFEPFAECHIHNQTPTRIVNCMKVYKGREAWMLTEAMQLEPTLQEEWGVRQTRKKVLVKRDPIILNNKRQFSGLYRRGSVKNYEEDLCINRSEKGRSVKWYGRGRRRAALDTAIFVTRRECWR